MRLAFCGLGLMGEPMARRLLQAGHQLKVWNRSPAKADALVAEGAVRCATPAEAATDVDVVILCLLDAAAVEQVVFGPRGLAGVMGWRCLLDHTSMDPSITRQLANRLEREHGAQWIDAPVSGGVAGAKAGTLAIMAGGEQAALENAQEAMAAYASRVTMLGPTGAGQTAKLCNQIIVSAAVAAVAEALSLARAAGIDAARLPDAFSGGWADSKPMQVFAPRMLETPADVLGTVATMLKDVDTVMSQAKSFNVPTPVTASVQQTLRQAASLGLSQHDLSAVVCVSQPDSTAQYLDRGRGR